MATYYVDPENGSDAADGLSESTPWKLIPGQTGANAVLAGDIINVKNGTTSRLRVIAPANNLTYRGYGKASNRLSFFISANATKQQRTVFREQGVHEGMWTLDGSDDPASVGVTGYFTFFTRSGCVLEDCEIIAPKAETTLSVGTNSSTAIGATIRRCKIVGSASTGITIYTRQVLLEDILILDTNDDAITIGASSSNGSRIGYTDTMSRISIVNPGKDIAAFLGDAIQTQPNGSEYLGKLNIFNLYIKKDNGVKQAVVFNDGTGGILLSDFFFESSLEGHAQILLSGVKGKIIIENGRVLNGCAGNAFVRLGVSSGIALDTGAEVQIKNCIVSAIQHSGFFTAGSVESAATLDGSIKIFNCLLEGENTQAFSYSGAVSVNPASVLTIGANASLLCENNIFVQTGTPPIFTLPSGDENSSKWQINNNAILTSSICAKFGSSVYDTVSEFEAAHSNANDNLGEVFFNFNTQKRILTPSLLNTAGKKSDNLQDQLGSSFRIPPSLGPFSYFATRTMRS